MRLRPWHLLPALLTLLIGACHTAGRAWRITPFDDTPSADRVNLWPIAYHSGDETSVLWPLFDIDDRGFALRPLVAKDGTGWSILWPLASFDTEDGTGWVVPFYRFESAQGLFPVANLGSVSWVGPWWWTDKSRGLFPVAGFGRTSYVGPFWWRSGDEGRRGGLFPLAYLGPRGYVGPAWWTDNGFGLFPLFGVTENLRHVGPVWWGANARSSEGGLFPLAWWGDGGRSLGLLPFYFHDLSGEKKRRDALLGLVHSETRPDGHSRWVLPLYYDKKEKDQRDTALLPFFYKRVRGDQADVYTLIGNRSIAADDESFNLYPLWWSSRSGSASWKMLFPLFYFERDGDERTLLTPLGGRGWDASGKPTFTNVLGPIYHHSENVERDESRTAFLWPLFERKRSASEVTTRLAGLWTRRTGAGENDTSWAFGLGDARSTQAGSAHRFWPLYSWAKGIEQPDVLYPLSLFAHHETVGRSSTHLFPLYSSRQAGADREWNALLGLVHQDRGADGSRSTRAWPLLGTSTGGSGPRWSDLLSLVGRHESEERDQFQLGFSLLYSHSATRRSDRRSDSRHVLHLYSRSESERLEPLVPTSDAFDTTNRVQHERTGFLLGLFSSERARYRVWNEGVLQPEEARILARFGAPAGREGPSDGASARRVLADHGVEPSGDDSAELLGAVRAFADEHTSLVDRREVGLWPLWSYERSPGALSWSTLLGMASYDRDAERRRFHFLWYGYRSETRGERTTRDIFPFITWDSGPRSLEWSFLWRLLHYERKGTRRGGHVLFVPIGDV
jgi:hypothetical protein